MHYVEQIKTGVRGVGYVRLRESTAWPAFLQRNLLRPRRERTTPPATARR
jgi:HlyD family secretion protein